jgi:hypothetical protein
VLAYYRVSSLICVLDDCEELVLSVPLEWA